jgi:hypothetical protein
MKNQRANISGGGAEFHPVEAWTHKKNWLSVNIGDGEAKEIRALSECLGVEYRQFLSQAVRSAVSDAERRLQISLHQASALSRKRRLEMGRRNWEFFLALAYCSGEGN